MSRSPLRRLQHGLGFGRPHIKLDEQQHAELRERYVRELHARLSKAGGHDCTEELIKQATDDYQEQDRRSDRAERRAVAIQAAVATLLGLTTAAGGLLISSGIAKAAVHRVGLAMVVIFIVISLILTAIHALSVQAAQHEWVRPNAARSVMDRADLSEDFQVETLATLMAAASHNAKIADWKYWQLQQTARAFRVALAALVLVPIVMVTLALIRGG